MSYKLEGSLLEVCDCKVLCPCWIGENPDNGTCRGTVAHHYTSGRIDDVDVSGLTIVMLGFIPGNVLEGNWRVALFVGEVVSVERVPIRFDVADGKGTLSVGSQVFAEMAPYRGPSGEPTKLVESIFSTIPGSPAYVAKASRYRAQNPRLGIDLDLAGHNAIQGHFAFQA